MNGIEYGFNLIDPPSIGEFKPFQSYNPEVNKNLKSAKENHWKFSEIKVKQNVRAWYFKQEAGKEINRHLDTTPNYGPVCGFNFLLKGSGPIVFDDGPFYYKAALLNIAEYHSVPATDERLILKLNIPMSFDRAAIILDYYFDPYQDIYWNDFISVFN